MSVLGNGSFLRRILVADAVVSGAAGLLMALGADPLQELLAVPATLLRYAGMSLIPFAAALLFLSRRETLPHAAVSAVIALNLAWAALSVVIVVAGAIEPNRLGAAFVVVQAIAVAGLAELEYVGLRRSAAAA